VKWSESHTRHQQIWGNLVAPATWRPGFVHPCQYTTAKFVLLIRGSWLLQHPGNMPSYWAEYTQSKISGSTFEID